MNNILWLLIFINIISINQFLCNNLRNNKTTLRNIKHNTTGPIMKITQNSKSIRNLEVRMSDDLIGSENKSKINISGIRLEPIINESKDFNGYSDSGILTVKPNDKIKIVIFGYNLQSIEMVGFTKDDNCSNVPLNVSKKEFIIRTNFKLILILTFPDQDSIYKLCYCLPSNLKNCTIVDGNDTNISTKIKEKEYLLPLWIQILLIILFIILSGLFSGLNLGLMTLTPQELELICKAGTEQDQKYANIIIPVRKRSNLLLCSLLIGNVIINSAISIMLDDMTSGPIALVVSSTGIVLFGEIIPQSLCVKKGLAVGAKTIWITKFFIILTLPVAYPLSKLLDLIIGVEVTSYDRKKLMELIKMTARGESAVEFKIAFGAMEITDKTVKDCLTKIEDVFMVPETTILNANKVTEIVNMGYTRIPVYANNDRNNVVSLLFIKDLALMDPDDNFTVKTVCDYNQHTLRFVGENTPLKVMLEEFKKGDYHLAMVCKNEVDGEINKRVELSGLVTLEDILEEILKAEIIDESDVIIDNVNKTKRKKKKGKYLSHLNPKKIAKNKICSEKKGKKS